MKRKFKYSKKVLIISISTLLVMTGITMYVYCLGAMFGITGIVIALCWLLFVVTACFAPLYYTRDENGIRLRLMCFNICYPSSKYEIESLDLQGNDMIRLFGSGGFMGYYGYFHKKEIGKFILFCTDEKGKFIKLTCKSNNKTILIEE